MSETVSVADQAFSRARGRDEYRPKTKTDLWLCWYIIPIFFTLFGIMFVPLGRVMPPPLFLVTSASIRCSVSSASSSS